MSTRAALDRRSPRRRPPGTVLSLTPVVALLVAVAGCGAESDDGEVGGAPVGDATPAAEAGGPGTSAAASSGARPLLSETIREILEEEGTAAATERFEEIYPERREDYRIDTEGMAELGSEYMTAGDFERGGAVMEMVATLAQADLLASMPDDLGEVVRSRMEEQDREDAREADADAPGDEGGVRSRPPLPEEVVRRFAGVYADPAEADPNRRFFLAEDPCGGAMMFGAMWGDAQNTFLRVDSERVLLQPEDWMGPGASTALRIEATLGPDGRAESLSHNSEWFASPLVRTGELPESWADSPCTRG